MLGVLVTFRYGNQFNEAQIRQVAEDAQARFKGMPGLRSKAFTQVWVTWLRSFLSSIHWISGQSLATASCIREPSATKRFSLPCGRSGSRGAFGFVGAAKCDNRWRSVTNSAACAVGVSGCISRTSQ